MTLVLTLERVRARLPRAARDATRRWIEREGIAIAIADGALVGRAEAAPLPGLSTDTLEDAERALRAIAWHGVDPEGDDPLSLAARLVGADAPAARFAIEAALLDLAGQRRGLAVCAVLSEAAPAASITTAALLDDLEDAVDVARRAIALGAGAIKVKIGRAGRAAEEVALLRSLRAELGERVRIRADANGALGDRRSPLIAALAEIGAELLEDPFALEVLLDDPALPVPVALDESLARDPTRALRAIERGRAHAVVLKPAALGGVGRALAIAEAARERGARVIVSHAYDAPRAFAACGHLALALAGEQDAEVHGLARYDGLDAWRDPRGDALRVPIGIGAYRIDATTADGAGGLG